MHLRMFKQGKYTQITFYLPAFYNAFLETIWGLQQISSPLWILVNISWGLLFFMV